MQANTLLNITAGSSCMSVHNYPRGNPRLVISIDVDDFCANNNYNGDHAYIDLTLAQVRELRDYLTRVLNANKPT